MVVLMIIMVVMIMIMMMLMTRPMIIMVVVAIKMLKMGVMFNRHQRRSSSTACSLCVAHHGVGVVSPRPRS
jgi:hypothetical protein